MPSGPEWFLVISFFEAKICELQLSDNLIGDVRRLRVGVDERRRLAHPPLLQPGRVAPPHFHRLGVSRHLIHGFEIRGASIYDVHNILGLFDPLPSLSTKAKLFVRKF